MNASMRVEEALQRLKDVYLSDPVASLTVEEAAALTELETYVCHALMEALADARFLQRDAATFVRNGGAWHADL
jgi:hypothetical protein